MTDDRLDADAPRPHGRRPHAPRRDARATGSDDARPGGARLEAAYPGRARAGGDEIPPTLAPGQLIARGVCRALSAEHDFACAEEVTLSTGLRVDVMALGPRGEIWVVECKSCRADFVSDGKWQGYLDWADRFFWAVGPDFPTELLPEGTGLILADAWGAEIVRMGPETRLAGTRRKALTLRLARLAARRAQAARDPGAEGRRGLG